MQNHTIHVSLLLMLRAVARSSLHPHARGRRNPLYPRVATQALRYLCAGKAPSTSPTKADNEISKTSTPKALTNEQILKIANIDLVSKKEVAIMEREKKIMTVYAFGGLALSLFGMSLGVSLFMSI